MNYKLKYGVLTRDPLKSIEELLSARGIKDVNEYLNPT